MECISRKAPLLLLSRAVTTSEGSCESPSPSGLTYALSGFVYTDVSETCMHAAVFVFLGPRGAVLAWAGG